MLIVTDVCNPFIGRFFPCHAYCDFSERLNPVISHMTARHPEVVLYSEMKQISNRQSKVMPFFLKKWSTHHWQKLQDIRNFFFRWNGCVWVIMAIDYLSNKMVFSSLLYTGQPEYFIISGLLSKHYSAGSLLVTVCQQKCLNDLTILW